MFGKAAQAELEAKIEELEKDLAAKEQELTKANNHIATLIANAKRWSKKFQNPLYSVPNKVISQMEEETKQYKQRTRAKMDELAAKNAVLMDKVMRLQGQQTGGFGKAAGNKDMDFDFATSHTESHIQQTDRDAVEMELDEMVKKHFEKYVKRKDKEERQKAMAQKEH